VTDQKIEGRVWKFSSTLVERDQSRTARTAVVYMSDFTDSTQRIQWTATDICRLKGRRDWVVSKTERLFLYNFL